MKFKRDSGSIRVARFTHYSNDELPFLTNNVPSNGTIRIGDVFMTTLEILKYMWNTARADRLSGNNIVRVSVLAHWEIFRYIIGGIYLTIGIALGLWLVSEQHLTLFN